MRGPILLNSNNELQDQDGVILAKLVEGKFGRKVVELINREDEETILKNPFFKAEEVLHTPIMELGKDGTATEVSVKMSQSGRMKEYWRKKKGIV